MLPPLFSSPHRERKERILFSTLARPSLGKNREGKEKSRKDKLARGKRREGKETSVRPSSLRGPIKRPPLLFFFLFFWKCCEWVKDGGGRWRFTAEASFGTSELKRPEKKEHRYCADTFRKEVAKVDKFDSLGQDICGMWVVWLNILLLSREGGDAS